MPHKVASNVTTTMTKNSSEYSFNLMTSRLSEESLRKRSSWWQSKSRVFHVLGYASVAIVPITLVILLPLNVSSFSHSDVFEGAAIGGSLTLSQAKAIDFISSAVFAPLILTLFNYIWFENARTSIANDRNPRNEGTSLYAFVEASHTSSGTYDVHKLWVLCRSSSIPLMLLAALALFAALARSSLSNIIAYEAYTQTISAASVELRLLRGAWMYESDSRQLNSDGSFWYASYHQQRLWSQQYQELLTQVTFQNSTPFLNEGVYVATNVTRDSLSAVASSTTELHAVPAFRAEIDCQPHTVKSLRWLDPQSNYFNIYLDQLTDITVFSENTTGWKASFTTDFATFKTNESESNGNIYIPFFASNSLNNSVYVGVMSSFYIASGFSEVQKWIDDQLQPVASVFGDIQATSFNLTELGISRSGKPMPASCGQGTNGCTVVVFGLICTINQRAGTIDLDRASGAASWNMSKAIWRSESTPVDLTYDFNDGLPQAVASSATSCNASGYSISDCDGIGSSLRDYNFETLAHNVLYTQMEQRRIGYEIAAMPDSENTTVTPDLYANVTSGGGIQRYRMTYVPALLFAGLICVFFAAVITVVLIWYSAESLSSKQFRTMDSLRLLMDFFANIQDEKILAEASREWTNKELEEWAKQFMVRYETQYRHRSGKGNTTDRQPVVALTSCKDE